jgi:hypothetical protein
VDQIASENKAGGIDYVKQSTDAADADRSELQDSADQLKAKLATQWDGIKLSSFTPTAATLAANAAATDANKNRNITGEAPYDASAIGMAAKQTIVADSLSKVGGGGFAVGPGSNPILEENKRQTSLLAQIAQSLRLPASNGAASFDGLTA